MTNLKKITLIILLFLCSLHFTLAATPTNKPLQFETAFQFNVKSSGTDSLVATWNMVPGYYLYRDRFHITIESPPSALLGKIIYPKGIEKTDEILGTHDVYFDHVSLSLPISNTSYKPLILNIGYQGCSESGFCYPPTKKKITLTYNGKNISDINITSIDSAKEKTNITGSEQTSSIFSQHNLFVVILLFLGIGLLLSFTPCVLPMIPILSGIIVGQGKDIKPLKAFSLSLIYVLSMAFTFAIFGIVIALIGSNLQAIMQTPWIIISFSILFVLLALSLFGLYEIKMPEFLNAKLSALSQKQKAGNYIGVAVMGVLSTLIVSPCVSAPLVGALAYIANTGNIYLGGTALFAMALGMGIPLLIIGSSLGVILPKAGAWMDNIKIFFGILLLGVAIILISRIIPGDVTLFLWGALTIVTSVILKPFAREKKSLLQFFTQGLALILLIYGAILIVGAALGNDDLIHPLSSLASQKSSESLVFTKVKSIADVQNQFAIAKKQNKNVMLDFYADWCVSCKAMAKTTFKDPKVLAALKDYILLQADVTANDKTDQALQNYYGVIAPPTIIFFDKNGKEIANSRIVGEVNAEQFISHIED